MYKRQGKKNLEAIDRSFERRTFEVLPAGGMEGRTRAMLKIEDGCVNFCTYCIIPYARGPVRSLPMEQAVEQTAQLAAEGYREIVLTGIEISSWGHDLKNGKTLIDLLEALSAAAPQVRLRLGSLEPRTITEDFCRRAAALPNLCPQFHPVSYTHLDVYKRQHLGRCRGKSGVRRAAPRMCSPHALSPRTLRPAGAGRGRGVPEAVAGGGDSSAVRRGYCRNRRAFRGDRPQI